MPLLFSVLETEPDAMSGTSPSPYQVWHAKAGPFTFSHVKVPSDYAKFQNSINEYWPSAEDFRKRKCELV